METEAVDVAVAVARKLCSELIAREPLGEITALVSDCFSQLVSTPHLVVRINDSLYEAAHERIEQLAKQSGFEGRLVILAEPEIETGDCRSNGRTAASCWSARRSRQRSTNSSDATSGPAIRLGQVVNRSPRGMNHE